VLHGRAARSGIVRHGRGSSCSDIRGAERLRRRPRSVLRGNLPARGGPLRLAHDPGRFPNPTVRVVTCCEFGQDPDPSPADTLRTNWLRWRGAAVGRSGRAHERGWRDAGYAVEGHGVEGIRGAAPFDRRVAGLYGIRDGRLPRCVDPVAGWALVVTTGPSRRWGAGTCSRPLLKSRRRWPHVQKKTSRLAAEVEKAGGDRRKGWREPGIYSQRMASGAMRFRSGPAFGTIHAEPGRSDVGSRTSTLDVRLRARRAETRAGSSGCPTCGALARRSSRARARQRFSRYCCHGDRGTQRSTATGGSDQSARHECGPS